MTNELLDGTPTGKKYIWGRDPPDVPLWGLESQGTEWNPEVLIRE